MPLLFFLPKGNHVLKNLSKKLIGAKRRKGSGEYGPQCPTGAVLQGLGVDFIFLAV